MATNRFTPAKIPDYELAKDARIIRQILRKYALDPRQYSAILPLHPASIEEINKTRCLRIADVLATMYERESIYENLLF